MTDTPDHPKATAAVAVWDLPTRLFHWGLVATVAVAVASGLKGAMAVHVPAGLAALALLLFRLAWGVVGSDTARFGDFVRGPAAVRGYLRAKATGTAWRGTLGHNPMGALMVVALLAALLLQAATGLMTTDDVTVDGPLYARVPHWLGAAASTLHRLAVPGILGLIVLHVLAVLVYRVVWKENLVLPMLTGRKRVAGWSGAAPRMAPWRRAAALAAASVALVLAAATLG